MATSKSVQEKPAAPQTFREWLIPHRDRIAHALPNKLSPDRIMSAAVMAVHKNKQLQECSYVSVLATVIEAAVYGFELSGPLGLCYPVPYKNECTFQLGYRGLIQLAFRTKQVEHFNGSVVRKGDTVQYERGTDAFFRHIEKPWEEGDEVPKPVVGRAPDITAAYATIRLKGGGKDFEVWPWQRIEAHRMKYSRQKWGEYNPWYSAWPAMAVKTLIKQLGKRVPLTVEIANVIDLDDLSEAGRAQGLAYKYGLQDMAASSRSDQLASSLGAVSDLPEMGTPLGDFQLPAGAPADATEDELRGTA